eukprot:jgi/Bigna1/57871/fgenesh1_pm.33_\
MGSFGGGLSSLKSTKLGSLAIRAALEKAGIKGEEVDEVFMGNVLSAGLGQAPARQAALGGGVATSTPCTTINKVCSSGMKAIEMGMNAIMLGKCDVVVCGGMESMSSAPFLSPKHRFGARIGHDKLIDSMMCDGLTDAYSKKAMGFAGELCADKMKITREEQDAYALQSYERAKKAYESGAFEQEILPVTIKGRKGKVTVVAKDEEANRKVSNISKLRPAFDPKDAALEPMWFTTAPSKATMKVLERARMKISDMDLFEFNEAFSVVALANQKILGLEPAKVNVNGGAVSLGHPLGCSGARIVVTLIHALKNRALRRGLAAICNGGGGASALIVESMS